MIGLQQPLSGAVETTLTHAEIGLLFQDDALLPWKTARDNVVLGLTLNGMERGKGLVEADTWLERLGLTGFGDRFPRHLSGGQRKRVALAQVLARRPKLILMDEPFASLDAISRAEMQEWLATALQAEPVTVVLVTHDVEEALYLCDRVAVLSARPARTVTTLSSPTPRATPRFEVVTSPEFTAVRERALAALAEGSR